MVRLLILILLSLSPFSALAQSSSIAALPNQPAKAEESIDGNRIMVGWSETNAVIAGMTERQTPNNPIFSGAELWKIKTSERDPHKAAINAFRVAGLKNPRIVAKTELNSDAIDVLDSHPKAQGYAMMLEGELSGMPAYGIVLILYGSTDGSPRKSTLHAFMAPKDKFEALGGFSIVAAKWLHASASQGEDMSIEGGLAPQLATNRLALFFNKWVEAYVIPMMGLTMQMQMQSIQQMSSWNNAMNACGGNTSCTISQDGSGNWSASWD